MKLHRSKLVVYLDLIMFIMVTISSTIHMMEQIIGYESNMRPATIFIMVYLINTILYRISINTVSYSLLKSKAFDILLSVITIVAILNTLLFVVYIFLAAYNAIQPNCLHDILCNHISYATIVGSWIIINIATDNLHSFYNIYLDD